MPRTIYDILREIEEKADEIGVLVKEMKKPIGNMPEIPF